MPVQGTPFGQGDALTSRAEMEATGKVNVDDWLDADSDGDPDKIQAQFDRLTREGNAAARESADDAGALALWPLSASDPQYYALRRAVTDFAVARGQQIKPEPVADGKETIGVTGERVARAKMLEVWETILLRADTAAASAPVAEAVTYYPDRRPGCWPAFGPFCG
jgi:hypothetical protein